jgi:hypothetical protein
MVAELVAGRPSLRRPSACVQQGALAGEAFFARLVSARILSRKRLTI